MPALRTEQDRRTATDNVLGWIEEAHGREIASEWAWSCTPMPCGLPSDKMLDEGLALALGEVSIWTLMARAEEEMFAELKALRIGGEQGEKR